MMRTTPNKQSGFTAVELLITLFVAAAFIIAGYQLFNLVIKDGATTRAESRAGNVASDYLRRYADAATNPCTAQTPLTNSPLAVDSLSNVTITVAITCPKIGTTTVSKVEAVISYGTGVDTEYVRYATFVDKSTGASPVSDLSEGLLARYKFNGNGLSDVGSAHASIFGATPTTDRAGALNSAYAFTAAIDFQYANIPSTYDLGATNSTINLWVYQATASESGQYVKIGDPAGFGIGLGNGNFDNTTPGPEIIGLFEGIRWIDTNTALGTGWHMITLVLDSAGTPSIYRDGVLVGTYPGTNTQVPNGNTTRIGGRPGREVTGSIDDVRIYNRPLSPADIATLYTQGPK